MNAILGLDFGGTKLAAGVVNPKTGEIVHSVRCDTPAEKTAKASYAAMVQLARSIDLKKFFVKKIGVCFDGPVEPDNRTPRFSMHVTGWEHVPLAANFEKDLGIETAIGHDASAAALAEFRFGAGKGVNNMLYFTVSTGIGGGVIIDGKLRRGEHAWAGEMGHMTLKPDGPLCPCGRRGCLEALSSGPSIVRAIKEQLKNPIPKPLPSNYVVSSLAKIPRNQITARDIAEAVRQGDKLATIVWNDAIRWLGIGIASAANIINPGRVVLGGGLTHSGEVLFKPLRHAVKLRTMDQTMEVVPALFRENVGIVGAAAVVL